MARSSNAAALVTVVAVALYLVSPLLARRLDPNGYAGGRTRSLRERELRNTSAIAVMLGEFRTAMSDIMYIKSERYLDNGIAYMPHLKKKLSISGQESAIEEEHHDEEGHDEEEAHVHSADCGHDHGDDEHGESEEQAHDEHEDHDHGAGTPTIIPTVDEDFRGFIGHLERAVKPWRDPSQAHQHTDGTELLPWFRLMTLTDSHYVLGYTVGGWWLKSRNLDEALAFAKEGTVNNPDAFQVWYTLGQLHLEKGRRIGGDNYIAAPPPEALTDLQEARTCYRRAAELALKERPANAMELLDDPRWGHYAEEDARAALRMAALSEWHYGDKEQAVRMAADFMASIGHDYLLERLANHKNPALSP
jgi:tetratricopeptide (TPR) repeat protein